MRRAVLALLPLVVTGTALPGLAGPKPKPKPIQQQVPFRDATPDPTGIAVGSDGHCSGLLPREKAYAFNAPAAGTLKVTIGGFEGEWALQLRDPKDRVVGETDVPPPAFESLTLKVRKAGVVNVLPCNLAGTPDAVISLLFTYA